MNRSCFSMALTEWRYTYPLLEEAGFEAWAVDILGWGFSNLETRPPCDVASKREHLYQYGHVVDIDLKIPPRPPGYAFVEFEDPRDAEDAVAGQDGYNFDGHRLRVEPAHGGRGGSSYDRSSGFGDGGRRGLIICNIAQFWLQNCLLLHHGRI